MSYIQFNDYDSSDDLIITKPIVRPTWGKTVNEVTLPGNPRSVMQQLDCYENADFTISAVIADASPENVHRIYSSLCGFGKLLISTAPDEVLDVWIKPITPEPVALLMAEIDINVTARPFATALSPTDVALSASYTEINVEGTAFAAPIITVTATTGTAVITVNDEDFQVVVPSNLSSKEFIIDCDKQVSYYLDGGNKVSISNITFGDYPLLHTGKNYCKYSGTAAAAQVEYYERWL